MAYRTAPPSESSVLDFRPEPDGATAGAVVGGVLFTGFGLLMMFGAVRAAVELTTKVPLGVFGILALIVGMVVLSSIWIGMTTRVRLTLDQHAVIIDWRRLGIVRGSRRIKREDLREVTMLQSTDTEGEPLYQLVLVTAAGDITFKTTMSPLAPLARQRAMLTKFLELAPAAA